MGHPSCLQLRKKKAANATSCNVSSNVLFFFNYALKTTASPGAARHWMCPGGSFPAKKQWKRSPPAAPTTQKLATFEHMGGLLMQLSKRSAVINFRK